MFCPKCGTQLEFSAQFCSNCGTMVHPNLAENAANQQVEKRHYNVLCILGLVVSGISQLINLWGVVGIAGTILSVIGLISCTRKNEKGKALAIIGIVLGILSIVFAFVLLLQLIYT